EGIRRGLDPAAETEQERRDQQPPEGVVVAHGPPRVEQPGRRRLTVSVRLRHVEPALAEARGHPEQGGDGEDPAIVEVLEQLAGGEGQPDAEDGAELGTQDQADERAREPREDREQQRRGDVNPECSTHFGGETGPDHPDHYLVGRPVAAYPPGRRGCARVVSSPSRAGSRWTPAA